MPWNKKKKKSLRYQTINGHTVCIKLLVKIFIMAACMFDVGQGIPLNLSYSIAVISEKKSRQITSVYCLMGKDTYQSVILTTL